MSEIFKIRSSLKDYDVEITLGGVVALLEECSWNVVVDKNVHSLWPSLNLNTPIIVEALEGNKTLDTVGYLIESLREQGVSRGEAILAIGGGIIQDVSTFSASSYMRGLPWVYVPTTLLGMTDSCIGGKYSINVGKYKNIAGNFYPPEKVIVDVNFCKTLSEQQLVEGLCEAVKICYAHSAERLDQYLAIVGESELLSGINYEQVVTLSLLAKKEFIEEDEFDLGIRLLLNFGHTFGHALEGASDFAISHGIAVGLGMISAYKLSQSLGLLGTDKTRVGKLLSHVSTLLEKDDNLSSIIKSIDMSDALEKFKSDKKHEPQNFLAILFDQENNLVRHKFAKTTQHEKLILEAFNFLRVYKNEI